MAYSLQDVESDKAWEGLIYYKHKGTFVARYEAYWGVVRRESSRGLQRIDLFRQQSAIQSTSDLFIPLHDVLHVLNREARARKFAFQILGTGCKYHLATESGGDRERWVRGLEGLLFGPPQPGIVYEHQVHVIPNSHSERLQLSGRYVVRITDSHIALFTSTGTLPTRFLYSLSDITRTRYTNFTNSGQKFSVLVLYCCSNDSAKKTRQQNGGHTDESVENDSAMAGHEGMFVFQTQSASIMSHVIDHRTKEMTKRDGCCKHSSLGQSLDSSPPSTPTSSLMSPLPTSTVSTTPPNDGEPLHITEDHSTNKPCPPTRVAVAVDAAVKAKVKKTPIPLPRMKYSMDSTAFQNRAHPPDHSGQAPRAKPRPIPPPKPKRRTSVGVTNSNFSNSTASTDSPISCSLVDPDPVYPITPSDMNGSQSSCGGAVNGRPTYINLDGEENEGDVKSEIREGCENGEDACNGAATENMSHQSYYNLPPERGCENGEDICRAATENSHQRYYNLPPERNGKVSSLVEPSSEVAKSPTLDEFLARILRQRRESRDTSEGYNESVGESLPPTQLPVGRTLSSDSKLLGGVVDVHRENHTRSILNYSNTPQLALYYNVFPLVGARSSIGGVEGGEGERKGAAEGEVDSEEDEMLSLGEKEYRSEWLKREDGGEKEREDMGVGTTVVDNMKDKDFHKPENMYLKILPSTAVRPHPPPKPTGRASSMQACVFPRNTATDDHGNAEQNAITDTPPTDSHSSITSLPEIVDSPLTPEYGSPLWGNRRPWSRQSSMVPPFPPGGRQSRQNSPLAPGIPNSPAVPRCWQRSIGSPLIPRKKLGCGKSQATGSRVRPSAQEEVMFQWPSAHGGGRRSSGRISKDILFSRLPSVPIGVDSGSEGEMDSDYEWLEIGEALSEIGNVTEPCDLRPLGLERNLRRSVSCSELAPLDMSPSPISEEASPLILSVSHRPPAPLPTCSQVPLANTALVETPVASIRSDILLSRRSNFQRSRSLEHWDHASCIYENLECQVQYDYVRDSDCVYDYAAVPNRSTDTLFPRQKGEYVDINQHFPYTSSSSNLPNTGVTLSPLPALPPLPPRRPLTSLQVTNV